MSRSASRTHLSTCFAVYLMSCDAPHPRSLWGAPLSPWVLPGECLVAPVQFPAGVGAHFTLQPSLFWTWTLTWSQPWCPEQHVETLPALMKG